MSDSGTSNPLGRRAQQVLRTLVEQYIRSGLPVGSKQLREEGRLDCSPATIRNVMSDLEALGFISSPHTSAGRVPTDKGYRFFVDSLLSLDTVELSRITQLNVKLESATPEGLIGGASNLLSGLTQMAGIVTLPKRDHASLAHIEFIPLGDRRVLAILVFDDKEVQNRIVHTQHDCTRDELISYSNYLNECLSGKGVAEARAYLVAEMRQHQDTMQSLMLNAVHMAEQAFGEDEPTTAQEALVIAGQTNLMEFNELSSLDKLRDLFDAFQEKHSILQLLDSCLNADGLQIFIGSESGHKVFDGCSLVTSTYSVDGKSLGVLGVIGPTRMAYDRVIPIVDLTARLLGAALHAKS